MSLWEQAIFSLMSMPLNNFCPTCLITFSKERRIGGEKGFSASSFGDYMQLRNVKESDLAEVIAIETVNFSQEEKIEDQVLSFYVDELSHVCLAVESEQQVAGYILSVPSKEPRVEDSIFLDPRSKKGEKDHLAIASLSIAPEFKGQGLGTLLLAGLKEVAASQGYKGISLTCHDYLVSYYEMHGFEDLGLSESVFGGQEWFDMYWQCP